jgi:hypothetical protein
MQRRSVSIVAEGSCDGATRVRSTCGPPAAGNCGCGQGSPEVVLGEIPANERAGVAGEELGSFQVMRRS